MDNIMVGEGISLDSFVFKRKTLPLMKSPLHNSLLTSLNSKSLLKILYKDKTLHFFKPSIIKLNHSIMLEKIIIISSKSRIKSLKLKYLLLYFYNSSLIFLFLKLRSKMEYFISRLKNKPWLKKEIILILSVRLPIKILLMVYITIWLISKVIRYKEFKIIYLIKKNLLYSLDKIKVIWLE